MKSSVQLGGSLHEKYSHLEWLGKGIPNSCYAVRDRNSVKYFTDCGSGLGYTFKSCPLKFPGSSQQ